MSDLGDRQDAAYNSRAGSDGHVPLSVTHGSEVHVGEEAVDESGGSSSAPAGGHGNSHIARS